MYVTSVCAALLTLQGDEPGLAEQLSAWSTVAVAVLALVALFLPWWDRRRHQRTVDQRVAAAAVAVETSLSALIDEALIRSTPDLSVTSVKQLIPKLMVV